MALAAALKRLREKVRDRTGRNRAGISIEWVIEDLNPDLARLGKLLPHRNAAIKVRQVDNYVVRRLRGLLIKKRGRNLRPGQIDRWTEDWFNELGLHRLRGTICYPKAA